MNIPRSFYITEDANKALEEFYAERRKIQKPMSYSQIVSEALHLLDNVSYTSPSCEQPACGYYYGYKCECGKYSGKEVFPVNPLVESME